VKKLLAAGALIALFASPSLAQTVNPRTAHQAAERQIYRADTTNGPRGEVIRGGEVIGQDPDPAVRSQIAREWARGQAN
jgi:hypothetical protein